MASPLRTRSAVVRMSWAAAISQTDHHIWMSSKEDPHLLPDAWATHKMGCRGDKGERVSGPEDRGL